MLTTAYRLLALCLTVAAVSRPRDDAATATCLADPSATCDLNTPCAAGSSFTRNCLDTWVPFRTAHDRVTCCLDCCLQFFVKKYGLDANAARASQVVPALAPAKASPKNSVLPARTHAGPLVKRKTATTPYQGSGASGARARPPPLKVARGWSPAPSAPSRRAGSRCTSGTAADRTPHNRPSGPTAKLP